MKYLIKFLFVIFIIALSTRIITNNRKHCNFIDTTRTLAIDSTQTVTDTIKIK